MQVSEQAEVSDPDEEIENAEEIEDRLTRTIAELLPVDSKMLCECPPIGNSLLGHKIAWKRDIGWELGEIVIAKPKARTHNFEVQFVNEKLPRNTLLAEENYSTVDSAHPGSWACFV